MDVADLCSTNPTRPPDWRFRLLCEQLASGSRVAKRDCEPATFPALQYLQRRANCRCLSDRRYLRIQFPDLHDAVGIYESRECGMRRMLEAFLLTGAPPGDIAAIVGTTPQIIRWFEHLCFDVWGRLNSQGFIFANVIKCHKQDTHEWSDVGWKIVGYYAGIRDLTSYLFPDRTAGIDGITSNRRRALQLAITQAGASAAQQINASDNNVRLEILKLVNQRSTKTGAEDASPSDMVKNIDAMLQLLPFKVASTADDVPAGPTQRFDLSSVELNGDELMLLACGRTLPNEEELLSLRFPEAGEKEPLIVSRQKKGKPAKESDERS